MSDEVVVGGGCAQQIAVTVVLCPKVYVNGQHIEVPDGHQDLSVFHALVDTLYEEPPDWDGLVDGVLACGADIVQMMDAGRVEVTLDEFWNLLLVEVRRTLRVGS